VKDPGRIGAGCDAKPAPYAAFVVDKHNAILPFEGGINRTDRALAGCQVLALFRHEIGWRIDRFLHYQRVDVVLMGAGDASWQASTFLAFLHLERSITMTHFRPLAFTTPALQHLQIRLEILHLLNGYLASLLSSVRTPTMPPGVSFQNGNRIYGCST
jgi:hypothetical protein